MLEELKAILKSPKVWITMIGVALVPTLYNVIFLSSMWDPYGNVDKLPVAVVNEDKSATLNNKKLTIGDDMEESLAKSKSLDFHFTSATKAKKDLENGDYYMVITFPKDMSKKATSLLTKNPEKITINYQTTKGRSFVASKMSDSAVTKLREKVSKSITQTYTKAVFKSMSSLQTGMTKAADGGQQLVAGADKLKDGGQTLSTNLNTLSSSSQTFSAGATTLNDGLTTYTNGVGTLATGLGTLSSGVVTYTNGVKTLSDGSQKVSDGLTTYTNGVSQLATGLNTLNSKSQELVDGITTLQNESTSGVGQLLTGAQQLSAGLQQLSSAVNGLSTSNNSIDISTISQQLQNFDTLSDELSQIATGIASSVNSADIQAVQATSAYQSLTAEQRNEINNALAASKNNAVSQAVGQISQIQNQLSSLNGVASKLSGLSSVLSNIPQLQSNLNLAINGNGTTENPGLLPGSQSLIAGLEQLDSSLTSNEGLPKLVSGITEYTAAVSKLNTGASQLAANNSQLTSGMTQISSGAAKLAANNSQLTSGANSAKSGADQLAANNSQLTSGASKLADGANQIASGSAKLAAGGNQLTSGLTTLSNGANTLTSSLMSAGKQLTTVTVKDNNAKTVSSPVTVKHTDKDKVSTNGVGMAPYMMSVALMVASLSTNVIFAKALSGKEPKNRFEWVKNKLLINGIISTGSAIILFYAVQMVGVHPNHPGKTLLVTLLAAWAMMAVVTALVGWDNRYGSFISLIILLLQLGSSAGTYPIELSPKIFKTLQPFLPMSYSVSGLRQTISMTGQIGTQVTALIGFLIAFMILAVLIYRKQED